MVNFTILAGGYSAFIMTYIFDSDNNALSLAGQSETGGNPSWISLHPTNSSILYAVNENSPGALQSFVIDSEGTLSPQVSTVASGGDSPAFTVPLSTGQVAIMNYNTGNGMIIPTTSDPLHFDTSSAGLIAFPAPVSHPHMAVEHGDEVLVPDLGADKIWRLVKQSPDTPGQWKIQGLIEQPSGSGPRHIALADGYLYTLHELASTLTTQLLPAEPNSTSTLINNVSIVPPNPPAGAAFAAGEILIPTVSDTFNGSFVYTSNRNTGTQDSRGDAITIFKRDPFGTVDLAGYVFTGLDQIRGMEFFGDDDRFLVASGVAGSAGVLVFERTGDGGNLTLLASNTEIPNRTSFVILPD
ncbi:putative isomerase YbhE [Fomitiporia mediterranea MF3/22]|uniref:putative isomerase YbhE n=1 Tax=Fomitiporia mediterranea (strain MF3/22) TaxID=694068 RepID=UPI0004409190|nr:putative isomerase YbhE [Fomitiporia mediterranea MF3/22]EJD08471.1 putative isomerase YbhE [Fomitiporia mediterranea MF3/22]